MESTVLSFLLQALSFPLPWRERNPRFTDSWHPPSPIIATQETHQSPSSDTHVAILYPLSENRLRCFFNARFLRFSFSLSLRSGKLHVVWSFHESFSSGHFGLLLQWKKGFGCMRSRLWVTQRKQWLSEESWRSLSMTKIWTNRVPKLHPSAFILYNVVRTVFQWLREPFWKWKTSQMFLRIGAT